MLTSEVKNEIANLWDIVSSAGLAPSPYIALEQISCLIFLKHLNELDIKISPTYETTNIQQSLITNFATQKQASYWGELPLQKDIGNYLADTTFPKLRNLEKNSKKNNGHTWRAILNGLMNDAYFQLDPTKPEALHRLIRSIDKLFQISTRDNNDINSTGEVFEYLFQQASQNSKIGQLTTPPHIARFMVSLLDPSTGETIIDPAVGTGTLLAAALNYMRQSNPHEEGTFAGSADSLVGVDLDHTQTRISWVNLLLQGIELPICVQGNSLTDKTSDGQAGLLLNKQYNFVLADIPFGGRVNPLELTPIRDSESSTPKGSDRIELQFIKRVLALLKPGGRAALIIPQSVLTGSDAAQVSIRRELLLHHEVEAVIQLPGKVFTPHIGNSAAVLVVRKPARTTLKALIGNNSPRTEAVWFYEVSDDGVSVDPRKPKSTSTENDLQDALSHFNLRRRSMDLWESNKDTYFQSDQNSELHSKFLDPIGSIRHSISQVKQWQVPVRAWLEVPAFSTVDGRTLSSHDLAGKVRPEYVKHITPQLYSLDNPDKTLLDSGCIEAQNWSLELSRYKPLEKPKSLGIRSVLEIINELENMESSILLNLKELRQLLSSSQ